MKSDAQFTADWFKSHGSVMAVAAWMRSIGYDVSIPAPLLRGDSKDRKLFRDEGDIKVVQRVEVKHSSYPFTCENDYPFDNVIVDEAYKVDGRIRSLLGYVTLSPCGKYIALIRATTNKEWIKRTLFDKAQNRECEFYMCPKRLVVFQGIA